MLELDLADQVVAIPSDGGKGNRPALALVPQHPVVTVDLLHARLHADL